MRCGSPCHNLTQHLWHSPLRTVRHIQSTTQRGPKAAKGLIATDDFAEPNDTQLPSAPLLGTSSVRKRWNASAVAFLGDSVWELYVRRYFFTPPGRVTDYNANVVAQVCAEAQETVYELLVAGQFLSDGERDVLRWGKNAKITVPKRFISSKKYIETYQKATALECLVGYLYLTNPDRLIKLMMYLGLYSGNQ